jgi:TonB C terminal
MKHQLTRPLDRSLHISSLLRLMDCMKQSLFIRSAYVRPNRRLVVPLVGALASILLHVLLLTPVLLGTTTHKRTLPRDQNLNTSASEKSALTVVLVEDPDAGAERSRESNDLASLLAASSSILVPVAMPDSPMPTAVTQFFDEKDEEEPVDAPANSDPGHAMMFGRYVGQIDARIERAWIRPRTSIAPGLFACRVRIVQERNGAVKEIELVRCNSDTSWQMSLVRAIQSASPLPAPPDPKVFSRVLTLDFSSRPLLPGGDPTGFEPEARTVMN